MKRRTLAMAFVILLASQSACRLGSLRRGSPPAATGPPASPAAAQPSATPPPAYQALYQKLDGYLDQDLALVGEPGTRHPVNFAAELIVADDNRGTALLDPNTFDATKLYLDRLQALGIRGVKLAVQYPFFTPSFPHYPEYLDFYRRVAQEVHRRNMVLSIQASILFANTPFSEFQYDFSRLTFQQYESEDLAMLQVIVKELKPDYLTVIAEPDTAAVLTGLTEFKDPAKGVELVKYILGSLDRGTTKICAGTGSWTSPQYARLLAQRTSIDCVSIHIYPVNPDFMQNALTMAEDAHANGKSVIVTEAWLYKVAQPGGGNQVAASPEAFKLDAFSFWAPLDQKFMRLMANFADKSQGDLVSFFWSPLLFSYVDYQPSLQGSSYPELRQLANQAAFKAISSGTYSSTGEYLRGLIAGR